MLRLQYRMLFSTPFSRVALFALFFMVVAGASSGLSSCATTLLDPASLPLDPPLLLPDATTLGEAWSGPPPHYIISAHYATSLTTNIEPPSPAQPWGMRATATSVLEPHPSDETMTTWSFREGSGRMYAEGRDRPLDASRLEKLFSSRAVTLAAVVWPQEPVSQGHAWIQEEPWTGEGPRGERIRGTQRIVTSWIGASCRARSAACRPLFHSEVTWSCETNTGGTTVHVFGHLRRRLLVDPLTGEVLQEELARRERVLFDDQATDVAEVWQHNRIF